MTDNKEPQVQESALLSGVEHSDGRLAAAEEAKRTGLEFRSTAAEGVDIVPYTTAVLAGNEWSNEQVAERSELGDSLESGTKEVAELNDMKAKAHEDYANGVIRRRADSKRMDVAERVEAIIKRNDEVAKQHEEQSNAMADRSRSGEERVFLRAEQVGDEEPVTLIGQQEVKRSVTNLSESEEREMFKDKDRVAYGEVPFEAFVDEEASRKESRAEERDVPQPHKAGELAGSGASAESKSNDNAEADEQAKREQKKAEQKARREEEKRQRKAAEEAANAGESQE